MLYFLDSQKQLCYLQQFWASESDVPEDIQSLRIHLKENESFIEKAFICWVVP